MRNVLLALTLTLVASPLMAQIDVAVWGSWLEPQGDNVFEDPVDPGAGTELEFDRAAGFGISANLHWGSRLSTELAAYAVSADTEITTSGGPVFDLGSLDLTPITATLQFHFNRGGFVDPYIGAGAGYILANDLSSDDLDALEIGDIEIDDEITWLLNAGLDFGFTPNFGVVVDAKYLEFEPASRAVGDLEDTDIAIDPLLLSLGLRWRY